MSRYLVDIPKPKADRLDIATVYVSYQEGFSGFTHLQEIDVPSGATQIIFEAKPGYILASQTKDCDANIFCVMVMFTKKGSKRTESWVVEPKEIK